MEIAAGSEIPHYGVGDSKDSMDRGEGKFDSSIDRESLGGKQKFGHKTDQSIFV